MKQTIKTLSVEKDNFMNLSIERGKVIQVRVGRKKHVPHAGIIKI